MSQQLRAASPKLVLDLRSSNHVASVAAVAALMGTRQTVYFPQALTLIKQEDEESLAAPKKARLSNRRIFRSESPEEPIISQSYQIPVLITQTR